MRTRQLGYEMSAYAAPLDEDKLQSIEVTGTAIHTREDISQSTDTVDQKALAEQNLSLVQDALRNVPGITLNAGEGGSHGDSVNLRGSPFPTVSSWTVCAISASTNATPSIPIRLPCSWVLPRPCSGAARPPGSSTASASSPCSRRSPPSVCRAARSITGAAPGMSMCP